MLLSAILVLNAEAKRIMIKFDSGINPQINEKYVELNKESIDSLNVKYECDEYELIDYTWAQYLKNIIILTFKTTEYEIEDIYNEFNKIQNEGINIVEICKVELLSEPNEYLYSLNKEHLEDVYWKLYGDNDNKRDWRNYAYENLYSETSEYYIDILERHFSGSAEIVNYTESNGGAYPYNLDQYYVGYEEAYHATLGMWHHSKDYNDTYRAHDYATGLDVKVCVADPKHHWRHHPDLINRWIENPLIDHDFSGSQATGDPYQYRYHGIVCDGAFFASANTESEDNLDCTSSIGVAPGVKAYAQYRDLTNFLNDLQAIPVSEYPKVISASFIYGSLLRFVAQELENFDINLVVGRGYSDNFSFYHDMDIFCDSDNTIAVGDYDPDYRVKTIYDADNDSKNYDSQYSRVNISAPGWHVWTTGYIPGGDTSENTEYSVTLGQNTSIAVPQVAGTIALIAEKYPWMNAAQRKKQVLKGAHHLDDLLTASAGILPNRPDYFYGEGCLSVYHSLFLHGEYTHDFDFEDNQDNSLLLGHNCVISNSDIYIPSGEIRVLKGANALLQNCNVFIGDNVVVNIEAGASLTISNPNTISFGENIQFVGETSHDMQSFIIEDSSQEIVMNNGSFTNCNFEPKKTIVSLNNCSFLRSNFEGNKIDFSIRNSNFDFGFIKSSYYNCPDDSYGILENNIINNCGTNAIQLFSHRNIKIFNNNLSQNNTAIFLYENSDVSIYDNNILYNNNGIRLYHCINTSVTGANNISTNFSSVSSQGKGIYAVQNCQWNLVGNESAPYQQIRFNNNGNLHFINNSTPYPFKHNMVYSANHDVPFLKIEDYDLQSRPGYDVRYNYWGDDFNPNDDLVPLQFMNYNPVWDISSGNGGSYYTMQAEIAFNEALEFENQMYYVQAEMKYKEIITYYKETIFAELSLKRLYSLTGKYNHNFAALDIYLENNPDLQNNMVLKKVADYLSAFCKIKEEDYPEAIEYFESIIDNPQSFQDSIFAVIDAGYAYLLMESSQLKNNNSQDAYLKEDKFEELVYTMMKINKSNTDGQDVSDSDNVLGFKLSVYPNPFNPTTTISFNNNLDKKVNITIYNIKGQKVKTVANNVFESGNNTVVWNGDDNVGNRVASGLYFVKIISGQMATTKKIILIK